MKYNIEQDIEQDMKYNHRYSTENKRIAQVFAIIEKYHMITPGMGVIAGISGGADSVCLLYILAEYRRIVPFHLTAVHVEHGIRGEESLEDAAYTEELCRRFGVECRIVSIQAEEIARKQGISVEEAGRMERYRIFEEIREEMKADCIAVAHNQNDQAETMLWNLVRGSGLKGLGGIRPVRDRIIRPLLFTDRMEIETILKDAGIGWRTDRTNLELDYTRNRIRLSLLPQMEKELNSQAVRHMAEAAQRLQELQVCLEGMRDRAAESCLRQEGEAQILLLDACRQEEPLIVRELLRLMLERCGSLKDVGAVHIEMLESLMQKDCGRRNDLPGGISAVREDGILRVYRKGKPMESKLTEMKSAADKSTESKLREMKSTAEKPTESKSTETEKKDMVLPIPGSILCDGWLVTTELLENSPELQKQIVEENKYTKWISYDTIIDSVHFRTRKTGDYLVVNVQGGRKKLKDYLIDQKIPAQQREQLRVFADGSHILWVPGRRISMAAKVSPETKRVLKIQMKEEVQ